MAVLVAVASKYGATREIAEAIGRTLAFRATEGDFRDWDEIAGWAAEIANAPERHS
jgi:menaquinone-dependent protoporphyrinogen IX oxidase